MHKNKLILKNKKKDKAYLFTYITKKKYFNTVFRHCI